MTIVMMIRCFPCFQKLTLKLLHWSKSNVMISSAGYQIRALKQKPYLGSCGTDAVETLGSGRNFMPLRYWKNSRLKMVFPFMNRPHPVLQPIDKRLYMSMTVSKCLGPMCMVKSPIYSCGPHFGKTRRTASIFRYRR